MLLIKIFKMGQCISSTPSESIPQNMQQLYAMLRLMRQDKPIGTFLLLWPTLWALWLANQGLPPLKLLIIFILGTWIMRSAGCVVNDIFDRQFDKQVERTKSRPLAQDQISLKSAWILFFVLILFAFILVLQLNLFTIQLSFMVAAFTLLYPLCKRVTHLPQIFLGITFNSGILLAYTASINKLPPMAWLLFFIGVIWTIAYDTLYAMADKPDDIKIGVKSTAVLFGQYDFIITCLLYVLFFSGIIGVGILAHLTLVYFICAILSILWTSYHLYLAAAYHDYLRAFLTNNVSGLLIFMGFLLAA